MASTRPSGNATSAVFERPWSIGAVATAHIPPSQAAPEGQALPQRPQFATSRWRSTQVVPQRVCPAGQSDDIVQAPPEHVCPAGQAVVVKVRPSALHTRRSVADVQFEAPGVHPGARHSPPTHISRTAQAATV